MIYYNHTNTLFFNWRDYGEKITQEEFDDFVNNVDRSQLPAGETSKMSWAALPVEPACMGKAVGEAGRPLMLCGARLYIIT